MSEMKFQVGDRVRWGTAEGVVEKLGRDRAMMVSFTGRRIWFHDDGNFFNDLPGQPRLELIERPKKTRKVKVWRWERVTTPPDELCLLQTTFLTDDGESYYTKNGWTKVPGSEREIEVSTDE